MKPKRVMPKPPRPTVRLLQSTLLVDFTLEKARSLAHAILANARDDGAGYVGLIIEIDSDGETSIELNGGGGYE